MDRFGAGPQWNTIPDVALPHTSPFGSVDFIPRARYLPESFETRIEYEPVPVVVPVPTVRQLPLTLCWIFTKADEPHALVPSLTVTEPLALSFPLRDSETDRRCLIVNGSVLVPVPVEVVTEIGPVVALFGTVAVICVPEFTENVVAPVPLNFTDVAPVRFPPLMTTCVPHGPIVGVNPLTNGLVTVKLVVLFPVPPGPITAILPVVAVGGTVAVISVSETTLKVESTTPLNVTEVAPVKPVPVMVTFCPAGPLVGVNDVICGSGAAATVKFVELVAVPSAFVTRMGPVCVPWATVAMICVPGPSIVKASDLLPIFTAETAGLLKLVPVIVTTVPTGPKLGEKEVIVGVTANAGTAETIRNASTLKTATIAAAALPVRIPALMGKPPS